VLENTPLLTPRVYVFDLDGVLFRGNEPVPGAAECLARLRARTDPPARLFFLTNNSSQPRRVHAEKLTRMGMPAHEDEVVTSSSATADYLSQQLRAENVAPATRTALVVGGPGIVDELTRVGLTVRHAREPEQPGERIDYVVVGLAQDFDYHQLLHAQQAVLAGAAFIATNRDGQFPAEGGRVTPGAGSVVAAIEAASDTRPITIGKPEPLGLQTILRLADAAPEEAVMIGDRLDTDIWCGNRLGVPSVLVLTGITDLSKANAAPREMRPGRILKDLTEL
jgi:4-nitrophenyl phosphatase